MCQHTTESQRGGTSKGSEQPTHPPHAGQHFFRRGQSKSDLHLSSQGIGSIGQVKGEQEPDSETRIITRFSITTTSATTTPVTVITMDMTTVMITKMMVLMTFLMTVMVMILNMAAMNVIIVMASMMTKVMIITTTASIVVLATITAK